MFSHGEDHHTTIFFCISYLNDPFYLKKKSELKEKAKVEYDVPKHMATTTMWCLVLDDIVAKVCWCIPLSCLKESKITHDKH